MLKTQEMNKSRPSSQLKRDDGELAKMKDIKNLEIVPSEENSDQLQNDFIPDELLFALTQMSAPSDEKRPTNDKGESIKEIMKKGKPANVWHHKSRRSTFRHLTDHPRSHGTGVGTRDVSYIYDLKTQQPIPQPPSSSKLDRSSARLKADKQSSISSLHVPDSIIPDEYHICKSKAVLGLEYIDDKDNTSLLDVDKTLRIFPSLKPSKRHEVVQLLNTFEYMLQKSGVNDEQVELTGPSQIHHLLELVKKEQKIYDLAFSEIIRQVSVGCVERGQLLSKLRMKYADLLSRVPRQIKSLHAEVLAQRALDRRLTEELAKFKSTIASLTSDLKDMKSRDEEVTKDAEVAEVELSTALEESQTNTELLEEYHSLYELQRKRLENNIGGLIDEKDLWCKSALSLSKKVMDANDLISSKKLNLVQDSWSKLAKHFSGFLDDHDTTSLIKVENAMDKWRALMSDFTDVLDANDRSTEDFLSDFQTEVDNLKSVLQESHISKTELKRPEVVKGEIIDTLGNAFENWDAKLKKDMERFSSDRILDNKEQLDLMKARLSESTEAALKVFRRHKNEDGKLHEYSGKMHEVMDTITDFESQLTTRMNGESGLLQEMKRLHAGVSSWSIKIKASQLNMHDIFEDELTKLYDNLDEFVQISEKARLHVRAQEAAKKLAAEQQYARLNAPDVMKDAQAWVKQSVRGIGAVNGKLISDSTEIHGRMTQWMIRSLLHLAPDKDTSKNARPANDSFSIYVPIAELHEEGRTICENLANYTAYLSESVSDIVEMKKFRSKSLGVEDQDWIEFNLFKQEARDWIVSAENVMKKITGDDHAELASPQVEKKLGLKRTTKKRDSKVSKEETTPKRKSTQLKKKGVSKKGVQKKDDKCDIMMWDTRTQMRKNEQRKQAGWEEGAVGENKIEWRAAGFEEADADATDLEDESASEAEVDAEGKITKRPKSATKKSKIKTKEGSETTDQTDERDKKEEGSEAANVRIVNKKRTSRQTRRGSRRISRVDPKEVDTAERQTQVSDVMLSDMPAIAKSETLGGILKWERYRDELDPNLPYQRPSSPLLRDEGTVKGDPAKHSRKGVKAKMQHVYVTDDGVQVDMVDETTPVVSFEKSPSISESVVANDELTSTSLDSASVQVGQTDDRLWDVAMTEYNSRLNDQENSQINSSVQKRRWSKSAEEKDSNIPTFRTPLNRFNYGSMDGYLEREGRKLEESLKEAKKNQASKRNAGRRNRREVKVKESEELKFEESPGGDDVVVEHIDRNVTTSDTVLVRRKDDCPRERLQEHTRIEEEGTNWKEVSVPTIGEILNGDVNARLKFKRLSSVEKADVMGSLLKKIEMPFYSEMAGDSMSAMSISKFGQLEIETLAADENVVCTLLSDVALTKLVPPSSKLTESAYEAISKVDQLQLELIQTEKRAQSAEGDALQLQEKVILSEKRIRQLEQMVMELKASRKLQQEIDDAKEATSSETMESVGPEDADAMGIKLTPSQGAEKKRKPASGKKKKSPAKK